MLRLFTLRRAVNSFSRNASTLQRNAPTKKGLLVTRSMDTGRRYMGGHGPDISKLEAALYIIVGGGGFAAFGMYQTTRMRDRIEAFETGKLIPFKSLTDDELLVFREKFRRLHSEEEDEEETSEEPEDADSTEQAQVLDEPPSQEENEELGVPRRIAKSPKDTVIFVEPSED